MGSLNPINPATGSGPDNDLGFLATRADQLINWGRKNSLWPMPLGLSCCGIELMAMFASKFDLARFGAEAARFSPRQCDLMIVAGTLTWKMATAARTIYDQMPDPKWVMAMGVCSSTGGMYDSYAVVQGVDTIMPVDIYVPGCPPRPDAVIDAIIKLQKKIERESPVRNFLSGPRAKPQETGTGVRDEAPNAAVERTQLDHHAHAPAARFEMPARTPRGRATREEDDQ